MSDPYCYPDTQVLINKLDIHNAADLERIERRLTFERMRSGIPKGDFDLKHLQAIHHHLFQDVYDWAGKLDTRKNLALIMGL
jgi:cell filamentation protein